MQVVGSMSVRSGERHGKSKSESKYVILLVVDYMEVAYLSLIGTLMGLMFVSSRFGNRPAFQMKLVHRADTGVNIMARTTKFANSNPRIVIKNLQALQDKGYHIDSLNPDENTSGLISRMVGLSWDQLKQKRVWKSSVRTVKKAGYMQSSMRNIIQEPCIKK